MKFVNLFYIKQDRRERWGQRATIRSGHSASTLLGKGKRVDKESNQKMTLKGERAVKKEMSLTHPSMYVFCNSIFPIWFVMKL